MFTEERHFPSRLPRYFDSSRNANCGAVKLQYGGLELLITGCTGTVSEPVQEEHSDLGARLVVVDIGAAGGTGPVADKGIARAACRVGARSWRLGRAGNPFGWF